MVSCPLRQAGQTAHLTLPILFTWSNGCTCGIISIITGLYSLLGSFPQPKPKVKGFNESVLIQVIISSLPILVLYHFLINSDGNGSSEDNPIIMLIMIIPIQDPMSG